MTTLTSRLMPAVWLAALMCVGCRKPADNHPVAFEPPAPLEDAKRFEALGDWPSAEARYVRYIDAHPSTAAADYARIQLGRWEVEAQRCSQAYPWLSRAATSDDPGLAAAARVHRLPCMVLEGRHDEVLRAAPPLFAAPVGGTLKQTLERATLRSASVLPATGGAWMALDALLASAPSAAGRREGLALLEAAVGLLSPADIQDVGETLRRDGTPWRLVAIKTLRDAIEARDAGLSSKLAKSLRANGHAEANGVQALLDRVDTWLDGAPQSVGVLLPLSGRGREIGTRVLNGIRVANAQGLGLELVIADTGSNRETTQAALGRLLGDAAVVAVLGPVGKHTVPAAAKEADAVGAPLLAFSTDDGVTTQGNTVFRLLHSPREEIAALVKRARADGVERFTVLHPDHGYGRAMRDLYQREVTALGAQYCPAVAYTRGATSFIEPVRQVLELGCEGLLLADGPTQVAAIAPTLAVEGAWSARHGEQAPNPDDRVVHLLLPSVAWSSDLMRRAGRYLQGALVVQTFMPDDATELNRTFHEAFVGEHGRAPDAFAAVGYDAFRMVEAAVVAGAEKRRELLDALKSGKQPETVTRSGRTDETRVPMSEPAVWRVDAEALRPAH